MQRSNMMASVFWVLLTVGLIAHARSQATNSSISSSESSDGGFVNGSMGSSTDSMNAQRGISGARTSGP